MTFFLPGAPPRATHHAKRIVRRGGFVGLADRPELVAAKASLDARLLPHRPERPVAGPVTLAVTFVFPYLKIHPKRLVASGRLVPKTTRPDLSNLIKTLEDRLVAFGFLNDDAQVAVLIVAKWHGGEPGIRVSIEPLGDGQGADAPPPGEEP